MLRKNNAEQYEVLGEFTLSKEKQPIAFENKVQELMIDCGMTRAQAEKQVSETKFELELYYHTGYGLFAVESEAVDATEIYSPYTGEEMEEEERKD
jgi:hypothetical protein